MKMDNHYKTLGISPASSSSEIKSAYRKLAQRYHPDKHNGNTSLSAHFEKLKAAYEVLQNEEKRKEYDTTLFAYFTGSKNSAINTSQAFYDKITEIIQTIKKLNANQINYDWVTISALTLLRSRGIQIALLEEKTESAIFNSICDMIEILPYNEMKRLQEDIYHIFHDEQTQVKWEQIKKKKKGKERNSLIIILLALGVSILVATLIMISTK